MVNAENREKVVEKIQKLLALGTSSNPHEAALAAERATAMLLKYNLSLADLDVEKSPYTWHDTPFEQSSWRRALMYAVAKHNLCDTVITTRRKTLAIVGKQHNIEVVVYLYTYLAREIDRLAEREYKEYAASFEQATFDPYNQKLGVRKWKTAFREGAVTEIVKRLKESRTEAGNDCKALVVVVDHELAAEVRKRFGCLSKVSHYIRPDAKAYASGQVAGRTIALHQGVRGASTGSKQIG